ncbi:MAG: metallophosphoesterase [Prolixibacteraceae bacterium]
MKAKIISDIHLEFGERSFNFNNCDLAILAGDIHVGQKGLEWISRNIKKIPVLYVLGNHEYYKNSTPKLLNKMKDSAKGSNVHILENESIVIDGITFHGATLWTDFELFENMEVASYECEQKMNDYQLIRRDPSYSKLRAIDTLKIHRESIYWLRKSLMESKAEKNVVITHMAPSFGSIAPKYQSDLLSAAFASNLDAFILETKPQLWIHGHVHEAFDYTIGTTRIICNPAGYPFEENIGFWEDLIIEI